MAGASAPYQRIVEELRRRIEAGELRPGARVPSAREITRRWGVAIATATKALAALQREGLVRAVPGVGTVVASNVTAASRRPARRRGAPGAPPPELSRDRVVAAAIRVADAEGLGALSMRRVATELDAATMSLYRYVADKEALVVRMIDSALAEEPLPRVPPAGWRARLEVAARLQWRLFRRHPWLAPAMSLSRPQLTPNALRHAEWVLRGLEGLGLAPAEMLRVHVTLFSYTRGLATTLEPEAEAERDSGMTDDEWMAAQQATIEAMAGADSLSALLGVVRGSDFELDFDAQFEFGLARLLDGLEVHLRRSRPPTV